MHQVYRGPTSVIDRRTRIAGIACVCLALAAGIWFRFTNLDEKYFWLDESYVAMWSAGHSTAEADALYDDVVRHVSDARKLQDVDREISLSQTVGKVAAGNPENSPNHIILQRGWSLVFGDSPARLRALAAMLSLLCFPAVYWLCIELFASRTVACTAVALWAVSPFHLLFAQEARSYSLLAATTLIAGATLLRALRLNTVAAWIVYAAAATLGLYTHLFFLAVLAAHGAYVACRLIARSEQPERLTALIGFATAAGLGVLAFSPWLLALLSQGEKLRALSSFMNERKDMANLAWSWIGNVSCVFVDFGRQASPAAAIGVTLARLGAIALIGYCLVRLMRRTPAQTWLFVFLSLAFPALWLIVPDLLLGGGRSQLTRYWTAGLAMVIPAVAYVLGRQIEAACLRRRSFGLVGAAIVLALGVTSCRESTRANTWWNKGGLVTSLNFFQLEFAGMQHAVATINSAERPLVIFEHEPTEPGYTLRDIVPLCRLLRPDCEWIGTRDAAHLSIPAEYPAVYLVRAPVFAGRLHDEGWRLTAMEPTKLFWRAERPATPKPAP